MNPTEQKKKKRKSLIRACGAIGLFGVAIFLCARPFIVSHLMHTSAHLFHNGESAHARAVYRTIIRLDRDNEYAWDWLIYSYANDGQIGEALRAGAEALRINPTSITLPITLGDVYLRAGEYDKAQSFFSYIRQNKDRAREQTYLDSMPAYKTGMRKLATAYEKAGDMRKTREVLEELILTYPDDTQIRGRLAELAA
jgi:tetratricopeptide (TPR) repeat protein